MPPPFDLTTPNPASAGLGFEQTAPDGFRFLNGDEMENVNPEPVERPAYQVRVIEEKAELDAKIEKLEAFLDKLHPSVSEAEERRLRAQASAMMLYSWILLERIVAFV